ncbi:hypothetical protein KSX_83250 [Ktedonospora formicarum]|uniref:Uncharacterized protein n=1 Tax=Ktedonospora formicarum TaxID=2778364 RepID=A0A8J3I4M3_9CHLR|nr:hypothetical protein KSX_83250 [Ktedonospora formicarum]
MLCFQRIESYFVTKKAGEVRGKHLSFAWAWGIHAILSPATVGGETGFLNSLTSPAHDCKLWLAISELN